MKKKPSADIIDVGTREMSRHFQIVPTYTSNTERASRVLDATEVDRLLLNDVINVNQHATLNLLARKLQSFGYDPLKSPDYSGRIHADATLVAERKAQAMRGAVHMIEKMDRSHAIGKYRRKKLINLVMEDASWGHQQEELWACIDAMDRIFTPGGKR